MLVGWGGNNGSTVTGAGGAAASNEPVIVLQLDDRDHLSDDRIKPSQLRQLLAIRPDIALLLKECIDDEGLGEYSDEEDEEEGEGEDE